MSTPISVTAFAARQKELLDAELAAEVASTSSLTATSSPKQLSRSGLAIINLVISAQRTGLGGKNVLELESDAATQSADSQGSLGEHGIRVGDIVSVSSQPKGNERKAEKAELENKGVTGVVTKVLTRTIHVALDGDDGLDGLGERLWVLKMANDITYKRMKWVMNEMEKGGDEGQTQLMRICFGHSQPTAPQLDSSKKELTFNNPNLNDSQKEAIRFALASPELALMHGPPGTGKTYTVVELILQLIQQQKRVLVCGPSNISVDNIVERLAPYKVPIVRVGHPARLLPAVLDHSLEMLIHRSDAAEIVQDIRNEIDQKAASIKKTRNGRERRAIYGEMKDLRKEFQVRERKCTDELVRSSKVVLSTLHGSGGSQLRNQVFDVVIIDEASQALEAQCWVALFKAKKVILAGDHLQLGPTIMSSKSKASKTVALPTRTKSKPKDSVGKDDPEQAAEGNSKPTDSLKSIILETTLFDRLPKLYGSTVMRTLTTQYRMHESIMRFPSDELYEGRLVAADGVKSRLLTDLPYEVQANDDTKEPLIYYDTDGGDFPERDDDEPSASGSSRSTMLSDSKLNENEAALVHTHLAALIEAGVKTTDIAIITPYNAQRGLLTKSLRDRYPGLEIGSVDGFQGREKEAVIVSLVRSNDEKESGFVGDQRRLNVLMTRPKRQLCVIGDGETISKGGKFAKAWIEHLRDKADLRYPDVSELSSL